MQDFFDRSENDHGEICSYFKGLAPMIQYFSASFL